MMTLLLGLVAFVLTFGLWTQIWVQLILYNDEDEGICYCSEDPDYVDPADVTQHKSALSVELWQRAVMPPAFTQDCYSSETEVCQIADKTLNGYDLDPEGWKGYFAFVSTGLLSAVICGIFVRRWHRPEEV